MTKLSVKLRRGEGWFWGNAKKMALAILHLSIPVGPITKPFFSILYSAHTTIRAVILGILRVFWFEPLFRSQCKTVGAGFQMERLAFLEGVGDISIGSNVYFSGKSYIGFCTSVWDCPELIIGDSTFIGHGCSLLTAQSLRIGNHCLIAGEVVIRDYDGHPINYSDRRSRKPISDHDIDPVIIEDDVWVGYRAMILKGTTVGARSIVAAESVVTQDVPPDCVVGGNPAKIIKTLDNGI
ncbi:MAG: acyltransferase [Planctomycetota bacterium]|nr:acyltransferase [Planctomycetota bacterium]